MQSLDRTEIKDRIDKRIQSNKPFVIYRKPNEDEIFSLFQNDDTRHVLKDYKSQGFVFAPFDEEKEKLFIPFAGSDYFTCHLKTDEKEVNLDVISQSLKEQSKIHIKLVKKGINKINEGFLNKVVLSRKETIKNLTIDLLKTFENLLYLYKNAFVYFWFHKNSGIWFGATPEVLLKVECKKFETIALAGTQKARNIENVCWQEKEIQEQKYVTDYIVSQLNKEQLKTTRSETYTIKAGELFHIRTDVSGTIKNDNIAILIKALHPTPAVCGLPKSRANSFIVANENYDREYYTGFLGELNYNSDFNQHSSFANFFVNLRCMKIENSGISIFIGGGITKDSNSEKEWLETVLKSSTMKNAIKTKI